MHQRDGGAGTPPDQTAFRGQWWEGRGYPAVRLGIVRDLCLTALSRSGVGPADARFAVETLLDRDLQGDHLRGIADVPRWVAAFRAGRANPRPRLRVLKETRSSALIGEDPSGFYLSIARQSMALCIAKARREGIAIVGVRKNLGTLAPVLRIATASGLVAIGTIQGPPSIAPSGGTRPVVGNNPVGIGIPAGRLEPLILDMALSQTSATPIFAAAARARPVPAGLVLDRRGRPTTDPRAFARVPGEARRGKASQYLASQPGSFAAGGSLVPVGAYKGYGLALALGVLTSVLIARHPDSETEDPAWYEARPGTLLLALAPALFCVPGAFARGVARELSRVVGSPRKSGAARLFYPGQRSAEIRTARRRANLLPLPTAVRRSLVRLAEELEIEADLAIVASAK